ncbi:hypothetical protein VD0002_g2759 [Verticillium dahliae]|uniref:Uncharacterized protein n=1 Tax=Verticillium dahliae TaxID=27337 RepID=A0AA44WGX5_VERDA|nr:hypothetical protein BJF96_g5402 [Verticillium dahliae]PNH52825.1 hypothetical protein VD0003_g4550 [Verticillium dahliae]PNH66660.1 hypothetical protein VD0002_g2759 [Verticillium dahliae]
MVVLASAYSARPRCTLSAPLKVRRQGLPVMSAQRNGVSCKSSVWQ